MSLLPTALRRLEPFLPFGAGEFWLREWGHAPDGAVPVRVVSRTVRGRDIVLSLRPRGGQKLAVRPGQHVTLAAGIGGVRTRRSYSPIAAPAADGTFALSVRQVPGGMMSEHLLATPLAALALDVEPAFGPTDAPETLWLAAGSGVTPFVALAEALLAGTGRARLVLWERHAADASHAPHLAALARASGGRFTFDFVETVRQGRLDAAQWAHLGLDGLDTARACGPQGFIDTVRSLAGERLTHAEGFSPLPLPPVEADAPATVSVQLRTSGRTLDVSTAKPLLLALEDAGVFPAHGCRQGVCNRCVCGTAGPTRNLVTGEMVNAEAPVRLCVSRALGPLALDL